MIEKQNILDLIGGNARRYHSCIITCYSFDFLFFEERVLPRLRRAGMINVNVFVDARMYQKQLSSLYGREYQPRRSYSITPVNMAGAFHPKILLGVGKNHGFLAIGSGNLTNSGLSSNDEIWGAMHTRELQGEAIGLFKEVYTYLNRLNNSSYGMNRTKLGWIQENAKWLKEAMDDHNLENRARFNQGQELSILQTFGDSSIYQQLLERIPQNPPQKITIISPFFNKDGKVIHQLISDLQPEAIDVVVEERFGTIPYAFSESKKVRFYSWKSIKKDEKASRLHAKLIQLAYENQSFLLLGSPNATIEALGSRTQAARNAEMALLIESDKPKNWVEELGIEIHEKAIFNLKEYDPAESLVDITNEDSIQTFPVRIAHAELDISSLKIYLDGDISQVAGMIIRDRNFSEYYLPLPEKGEAFIEKELKEELAKKSFQVFMVNQEREQVSNLGLIHQAELLRHTNPDEQRARMMDLISKEKFGNDDLMELLEYAQFRKTDSRTADFRAKKGDRISQEVENDSKQERISEEDFNKNAEEIQHYSRGHHSQNYYVESLLDNLSIGENLQNEEDLTESNEAKASQNPDSGFSGDDPLIYEKPRLSFAEGNRLKKKIIKTLRKIEEYLSVRKTVVKSNPSIMLDDIQLVLIGLHLIRLKAGESFYEERRQLVVRYDKSEDIHALEAQGKRCSLIWIENGPRLPFQHRAYTIDKNSGEVIEEIISDLSGINIVSLDKDPSISIRHYFFELFSSSDNRAKQFLLDGLGSFLQLLASGEFTQTDREKKLFETYKKRLFFRALFLLLHINWVGEEEQLRDLLTLNILHFLLSEQEEISAIDAQLKELGERHPLISNSFDKNHEAIISLVKGYYHWKAQFDTPETRKSLIDKLSRNMIGKIIFKSSDGFMRLKSIPFKGIHVISPLGELDKKENMYQKIIEKVGTKVVFFESLS